MVLIDSISRYIQGVLNQESSKEESFTDGLLEYSQYTRPEVFLNKKVPDVLISGNHANIREWRRKESLKNTYLKRPELLNCLDLSDSDKQILMEIQNESQNDWPLILKKKEEIHYGHYKVYWTRTVKK